MKEKFIPIILGTDRNSYAIAKDFHKNYGVRSIAIGKKRLLETRYSKIMSIMTYEDFFDEQFFVSKLLEIGKLLKNDYENLILVACGDNYSNYLSRNKDVLEKYFIVPYATKDLNEKLENKINFYRLCDLNNIDYPKTVIIDSKYDEYDLDFEFPVILKANDSIKYLYSFFKGKKKAYVIYDQEELDNVIKSIYTSDYEGALLIQEYIRGGNETSFVLTTYSDSNGVVKFMGLYNVILEHPAPHEIGNYAAVMNDYNKEVFKKYESLLNKIGYVGLAHFDLKYDFVEDKYKVLEMNLRQGRGNYVSESGNFISTFLVEDYVYSRKLKLKYAFEDILWRDVPFITLFKYSDKRYYKKIIKLILRRKVGTNLYYKKDFSVKRLFVILRLYRASNKMFKIFYK